MTDIKVLIRKRSGKRQSLTAFNKYLTKFKDLQTLTQSDTIELTNRLEQIENSFKEFLEIQNKIEVECDDEHIDQHYTDREYIESLYFQTTSQAKALLEQNKQSEKTGNLQSAVNSLNSDVQINTNVQSVNDSLENSAQEVAVSDAYSINNLKLPIIQLPKFSGDFENWLEFRDTFLSIIHSNRTLSNIQKLHYLRSSLQGQAAQIIKALEICDSNYEVAWNLIIERYDNKCLLVNNHVKALFALPQIKEESAMQIRHLLDEVSKHTLTLKSLGQPVDHWSTLLIHMINLKLDQQTKREWQSSRHLNKTEYPTLDDMKTFLKSRCEILETLESQQSKKTYYHKQHRDTTTSLVTNSSQKCAFCDEMGHIIYSCDKFRELEVNDRINQARYKSLCLNCLKIGHFASSCKARGCKRCNSKHHTFLHSNNRVHTSNLPSSDNNNTSTVIKAAVEKSVNANCANIHNQRANLSTAIVHIEDSQGKRQAARILLDSGSESCFITEELCDRLKLNKSNVDLSVIGINKASSHIKYRTNIILSSICFPYKKSISCFVIKNISGGLTNKDIPLSQLQIPEHVKLADPEIDEHPALEIDVLIGANVFWDLLCPERINLGPRKPILQKTKLGWILAGPTVCDKQHKTVTCHNLTNQDLQEQLSKFWEQEECTTPITNETDEYCETYFLETTERDPEGRFIVSIPFKKDPNIYLGDSLELAKKRFFNLVTKLERNTILKKQYSEFMTEYKQMTHMSKIDKPEDAINRYYMPHHGVLKQSSLTTQLRVVFNASCKTTTGNSLNDCQYNGPILQDKLFDIIIRFRFHTYVLAADVEKMYRQVLINPQETKYQCILWRENNSECLEHYALNTVTYGTTSAPYLAVRALQQTAHEFQELYPKAAEVILKDFYVDDLLTGTDSVDEAVQLYKDITTVLKTGCFPLRKWISNSSIILDHISTSSSKELNILNLGSNEIKTLGLVWIPATDKLKYNISPMICENTKRSILSSISKLFDPLGLLGPCVITAKILVQTLWKYKYDWDDPLPPAIIAKWNQFKETLQQVVNIEIPRYIPGSKHDHVELHAFSDASEKAFGTCVYIKTYGSHGCKTNLLCAKSRVAPLKNNTIPRLELGGALLSIRLIQEILNAIKTDVNKIIYWCDSTIVLCWIKTDPSILKPYVAHRIQEIRNNSSIKDWHYVRSRDNPADLISRGTSAKQLENSIWWQGPEFLKMNEEYWPSIPTQEVEIPETKKVMNTLSTTMADPFPFNTYSTFTRTQRITAWCLRYIQNLRLKAEEKDRVTGNLTVTELSNSLLRLVKLAQEECFKDELHCLRNMKSTSKLKIIQLSPFLDNNGVIRVGGRLKNSKFALDKKTSNFTVR